MNKKKGLKIVGKEMIEKKENKQDLTKKKVEVEATKGDYEMHPKFLKFKKGD
jgi:hypothetical protein